MRKPSATNQALKLIKKFLQLLTKRLGVYGEIVQNENEQSLENILKLADNDMHADQEVMMIHGGDMLTMQPH